MLKFLRKYNKILLVVGGSFLMVAFLAPQAIQRLFVNPQGRTLLVIGSEKVSAEEMRQRGQEREAMQIYLGSIMGERSELILGRDTAHWIMLTRAARQGGFIGEGGDGQSWRQEFLPSLVSQAIQQERQRNPNQQPDREQIQRELVTRLEEIRQTARGRTRMTEEDFDLALARARGVNRMLDAYRSANRVSRGAVVREAASRLEDAEAEWVLIPGAAAEGVPAPTERELREFYETYRDQEPGENDLGVGYVLPPRVKMEYLRLDRATIGEYVDVPRYEVIQEYNLREGEAEERDQALDRIEQELHREKVDEVFSEADRILRRQVAARTRALETEGGYSTLPDGWQPPRMEELARTLQTRLDDQFGRGSVEGDGIELPPFPMPEVRVLDAEWLTEPDLSALEGIGSATMRAGPREVSFPELVMSVREIAGQTPLRVQVGIPMTSQDPLEDQRGNRYYVTVLEARDRSPPESMAEVRDRVEADHRAVAGYRKLEGRLSELESVASEEGLDAVEAMFDSGGDAAGDTDGDEGSGDVEEGGDQPANGQNQGDEASGDSDNGADEANSDDGDGAGGEQEADAADSGSEGDDRAAPMHGMANVRRSGLRVSPADDRFGGEQMFGQLVAQIARSRARNQPVNEQVVGMIVSQIAGQAGVEPNAVREVAFALADAQQSLDTEPFRDAVFEVVASLDPLTLAEDVPQDQRTFAAALPRARAVAVGLVRAHTPPTLEAYRRQAPQLARQVRLQELVSRPDPTAIRTTLERVFGYEALAERFNLEDRRPDDEAPPEPSEEADSDERAAAGRDSRGSRAG